MILENIEFNKELITTRHWSIDESNELYYRVNLPLLYNAYKTCDSIVLQYFKEGPIEVDIKHDYSYRSCSTGKEFTVDILKGVTDKDSILKYIEEEGKTIAISLSEPIIQNIFDGHESIHWPNGAGKSPDYLIEIDGLYYNLEVKAAKIDKKDNYRYSCGYCNAIHNKLDVINELKDSNSELNKTICIVLYYNIDSDRRKVYYVHADIVAMPLMISYKIDKVSDTYGKVTDLIVKSDGDKSKNNNVSIGANIIGAYDKDNTLYNVYEAFLDLDKVLLTNEEYRKNLDKFNKAEQYRLKISSIFTEFTESVNNFYNNITSSNKENVKKIFGRFTTAEKLLLNNKYYTQSDKDLLSNYRNIISSKLNEVKNTKIPVNSRKMNTK